MCIFADGQIDRSLTGTGVSGRLATQHARGNLEIGEAFIVESIVGTVFRGTVVSEQEYGEYEDVVPQITGNAHVTGKSEFTIDPKTSYTTDF